MEKLKVLAANAILGIVLRSIFRPNYSAERMRRNFERFGGATRDAIQRQFKSVRFGEMTVGGVLTEVITATATPSINLLYLHGGGFFMGSPSCYRRWATKLSYKANARIFLPDYRLAPENPFPAARDDVAAVYERILQDFPNQKCVVVGDSAGGGLALSLLMHLRDSDKKPPARAVLISPWTDMTGTLPSIQTNAGRDVWLNKTHLETWAPWYVGSLPLDHPGVSPRFGKFTSLPPLFIAVGDQEVLLDDARVVADLATDAGVQTTLHVGKGMQHVWMIGLPFLLESRAATSAIVRFILSD